MTSYIDITNLSDTITAIAGLGSPLTTLVVGFIGLIIVVALVAFVTGLFDDILAGVGHAFRGKKG